MKDVSVSVSVRQDKGNINHNNRIGWQQELEHIDKIRTKNNKVYKQEKIEDAYKHLFDDAVAEYNNKQKRKDRKIDNYYQKINAGKDLADNKEQPFYEILLEIGKSETVGIRADDKDMWDMSVKLLDDYMKKFEKNNPNLYVFNAVLHLDEETPHLHIDYIPVATGYKTGMNKRNSLEKALQHQIINDTDKKNSIRYDNATSRWHAEQRNLLSNALETELAERNLNNTHKPKLKQKHLSIQEHKAQYTILDDRITNVEDITIEQVEKSGKTDVVSMGVNKYLKDNNLVLVKKEDIDKLKENQVMRESILEIDDNLKYTAEKRTQNISTLTKRERNLNQSENVFKLKENRIDRLLTNLEAEVDAKYQEKYSDFEKLKTMAEKQLEDNSKLNDELLLREELIRKREQSIEDEIDAKVNSRVAESEKLLSGLADFFGKKENVIDEIKNLFNTLALVLSKILEKDKDLFKEIKTEISPTKKIEQIFEKVERDEEDLEDEYEDEWER